MTTTLRGQFHEFALDKYEARYWNSNGYAVAIVASIGVEGKWAAYIGGAASESEEEALKFVVLYGTKLDEGDARHFFPDLELPYRW